MDQLELMGLMRQPIWKCTFFSLLIVQMIKDKQLTEKQGCYYERAHRKTVHFRARWLVTNGKKWRFCTTSQALLKEASWNVHYTQCTYTIRPQVGNRHMMQHDVCLPALKGKAQESRSPKQMVSSIIVFVADGTLVSPKYKNYGSSILIWKH